MCCQLADEWLCNVGRESRVSQNPVMLGLQKTLLQFMDVNREKHKNLSYETFVSNFSTCLNVKETENLRVTGKDII